MKKTISIKNEQYNILRTTDGVKLKLSGDVEGDVEELLEGNQSPLPFLGALFPHQRSKFWKGDFFKQSKFEITMPMVMR